MTRNELIRWFIKHYPEFFALMQKTNHNYDVMHVSDYHAEGTVWTHTMMVMTFIDSQNYDERTKFILLIAGLLHDIGKIYSKELDKDGKKYMYDCHEGISSLLAVEVLHKLEVKDFITSKERDDILTLIALHGYTNRIVNDYEMSDLIKIFRKADIAGSVVNELIDIDIHPEHNDIEFREVDEVASVASSAPNSDKGECIFMVGLPFSGKSSYAKLFTGYKILSRKEEIKTFCKINNIQFNTDAEMQILFLNKEFSKRFNDYFEERIKEISKHRYIIIDNGNLFLKDRLEMMQKLNKYASRAADGSVGSVGSTYKFSAIVMLCPVDVLIKRNITSISNSKSTPFGGVRYTNYERFIELSKDFIIPSKNEGFDSVKYRWLD